MRTLERARAQTETILRQAVAEHPTLTFATSLSEEDVLLTHLIHALNLSIRQITLDTGKLHVETLELIATIERHFERPIERWSPSPDAVVALNETQNEAAIFQSIDARKACCNVRKLAPLKRALAGASAWMTGQRREQSVTRTELPHREFDAAFGLEKFNPLAHWTKDDVRLYLRRNAVPVNPLVTQGFASIGCAPCTRAIAPGEDERAGRWWWENAEQKECGLHNNPRRIAILAQSKPTTSVTL